MAASNVSTICFTCNEETTTYPCPGCSKYFCYNDLNEHRESLKPQFHQIEDQRNEFMAMLIDRHKGHTNNHPLINRINQWEQASIDKIRQTADEQRELIQQSLYQHTQKIQTELDILTEEMQKIAKKQDFNEMVINKLRTQLEELKQQLDQPIQIEIKESASSRYIEKLSINIPSNTGVVCSGSSSRNITTSSLTNDLQAFQMRPAIRDYKLTPEVLASNGDIVLICGKGMQENQGMLLVSYLIPSTTISLASSIRLLKVIKLRKKSVTQLETIPSMKIAVLLGDGIVSIFDIDSLAEITTISSSNVTLFSPWYEPPSSSAPSSSPIVPDKLRICVAMKHHTLFSQSYSLAFYDWHPQEKRIEENKDLRGAWKFDEQPCAIAFSADKFLIRFKRAYMIFSLENGLATHEFPCEKTIEPMISYIPNRNEWCIQSDYGMIFFSSELELIYTVDTARGEIPTAIVRSGQYVLALLPQSINVCTFNEKDSALVQQIPIKHTSSTNKNRLWMDAISGRIYVATSTEILLLEPTQTPLMNVSKP